MLMSDKKEKANMIVFELATYEVNDLLDNDLMRDDIRNEQIRKIMKIEAAYMRDMISMEQAVKLIIGKTE